MASDDDRVVRVGDRMRISLALARDIIENEDALTKVVEVQRIDVEPTGEKIIWMQKVKVPDGR